MSDANFHGHEHSECGEHYTVGPHRAWCFADQEWCYPDAPCRGCELPVLRARIAALEEEKRERELLDYQLDRRDFPPERLQ